MKKSKVIIPALGILVLSTAASITGTVAWFTANTKFNTTVGNFAVVKTNDDLKCVQTGGIGTQNKVVSEVTTNDIEVKPNYELTDASFNHIDETVSETQHKFIYAPDGSGEKVGKKVDYLAATEDTNATTGLQRASYMVSSTEHKVFSAFTWNMAFTVKFGGANKNYALLMDHTAGHSAISKAAGGEIGANDTIHGFRLAFVGQSANATTRVWADQQTAANAAHCKDLAVDATLAGTSYVSPALIDSEYHTALPTTTVDTATASARVDYLGKFVFSANTEVTLNFKVVAWFEGTDPTIVDTATVFDNVSAEMHFQTVTLSD